MKKAIMSVFIAVILASVFSACAVVTHVPEKPGIENVTIVSNSVSYRRDEKVPVNSQSALTAFLAKNEGEGMQFILNFENDVKNVSVGISALTNENGDVLSATPYRQYYIYVEKNPAYADIGYYPDALVPIDYEPSNSVNIAAGDNQGFWITVHSAKDQPAGVYTGEVTVTYDGGIIKIPVEVEVWDFAVPAGNSFETDYGISYGDPWIYMQRNGATDGWTTQMVSKQYYEFLLNYRINGRHVPTSYDAESLAKFLEDERVNSITLYISEWNFRDDNGNVIPPAQSLLDYIQTLRDYDILKYCHLYMFDEIGDGSIYQRAVLEQAQKLGDDVRIMTTSSPRQALDGLVDVFCGIWSSETVSYERYVRDWQAKGYDVWWYGCIAPSAPYPTYHTQDRLMSSRLVHWMQKDWNLTGNLYWTSTYTAHGWTGIAPSYYDTNRNQWETPYATPTAGDGYLVYSGSKNDGIVNRNIPVPTLRLESVRDGSEDNEYLGIMQSKIQAKLDEWRITDISADTIMDTYYTPLYNSMGDYNHSPEYMLEVRKQLAHDIMNDGAIVAVLAYMDKQSNNQREVRVYAEPNASVVIDGITAKETSCGNYSTYSVVFPVAFQPLREITVSVNGESYSRYLKTIEDAEYIELGCQTVDDNVKALELPLDYTEVRALYETNMFAPKNIKNIGNIDDQINAGKEANPEYEKVLINTNLVKNYEIRDCVRTDYQNTIPLVVTSSEIAGDETQLLQKRLTLYAPHGAAVKVENNAVTLVEQTEKYDVFSYEITLATSGRNVYEVEVSYAGKTEVYKKAVLQTVVRGKQLIDLTSQEAIDSVSAVRTNKYGTSLFINDGAIDANFDGNLTRISLYSGSFANQSTDLSEYTAVRLTVTNTGKTESQGLRISMAVGSAELKIGESGVLAPGQTSVVYCAFPDELLDGKRLKDVRSLKITTSVSEKNVSFKISNIMALSIDNDVN